MQQGRLDSERLSEELATERRELRAWQDRLKGKKEELERERSALEGEKKRVDGDILGFRGYRAVGNLTTIIVR